MIRRGDRVTVNDPADEYHGLTGTVASNEYRGLISGADLVHVQLDGRERWDVEGFYCSQLEPSFSVIA